MLAALVHACAMTALGFAMRTATFGRGWVRVPLRKCGAGLPLLSIIVPARDEERNIERCVRSLLAQRLENYEVLVVDDRSSDGTRAILAQLEAESPRLLVIDGAPLPAGWAGKPWAIVQAAQRARGAWMLFTDADSSHHPDGSASALHFAIDHDVAMLTIATYQELGSFWERAILPAILGMVLFATGPLDRLNDPADTKHALANGQYILFERNAYEALGTHAAVRDAIAEDLELARRIKTDGRYRMIIASGESIASVRMYRTFAEIWGGFVKNVYFGASGISPYSPAALCSRVCSRGFRRSSRSSRSRVNGVSSRSRPRFVPRPPLQRRGGHLPSRGRRAGSPSMRPSGSRSSRRSRSPRRTGS